MSLLFSPEQTILFQGDSITDAGRNREDPANLGTGYALMAAGMVQAAFPGYDLKFINRGISGNRAADLKARWQEDCLDLKPDWVSVLIGINDTWRRYDQNNPTSTEAYAENYRTILSQCKDAGIRIIMCEPFLLPTPADREVWREDLDPKIDSARKLAREFADVYVPFDGMFSQAAIEQKMSYWLPDGVHPSPAGHALMAEAWMNAVGA